VIRLATVEELVHIENDPVRPHIAPAWRLQQGREIYVLTRQDKIAACICVAYTTEVPTNESDLDLVGDEVAVFYTVWSYQKGAGRELVNGVTNLIKHQRRWVKRFVTLSPLTDMARNFHISNGATFLAKHKDCQNFEYIVC